MVREKNYSSPEVQVTAIKDGDILCSSDFVSNSPEKDCGFEWNDDLY